MSVSDPTMVCLYVRNVPASAAFWSRLLARVPVESSDGFAMYVLEGGARLALWDLSELGQEASGGGGGELCMVASDPAAVDTAHADWQGWGVRMLHPPLDLPFGRTFLAADPDGHRVRVYAPPAA